MGPGGISEEDVSTAQPPTAASPRIPHPDEVCRWAKGPQPPKGKGAATLDRLAPPDCDGRLRTKRDFQTLYNEGRAVQGKLMTLLFRKNSGGRNRCAYIASKKVGNAVRRNRAKRLLREAHRIVRSYIISGIDMALIARSACGKAHVRAVSCELEELCKKAALWEIEPTSPER